MLNNEVMNIKKCEDYIKEKHHGQLRIQGTPYFLHPISVAKILEEKYFDYEYYVTGLFHDLLEDTNALESEILILSNENVLEAVKLLTKEKGYDELEYITNISKNDLAKMVKLADRLHNLTEGVYADNKWKQKYIKETEKYFIPLSKNTVFEDDINNALKNLIKSL